MIDFSSIGRLPVPGDNVAIASAAIPAGSTIAYRDRALNFRYAIPEGHRFAVRPIGKGEELLSWGLPFGVAVEELAEGSYICNQDMLDALALHDLDFRIPERANFANRIPTYELDETAFSAGRQVERAAEDRTFMGYRRSPRRGAGTRNYIVALGTTSRTASFVRELAERLHPETARYANVDGVVAVAHTEGAVGGSPNNLAFLLRALAGFFLHSNVGAILLADDGAGGVTNDELKRYLVARNLPFEEVPHRFMTLEEGFESCLTDAAGTIGGWMAQLDEVAREPLPVEHLKIALQCGGSDAFSGISGNPLAAWIAREVICYGGSANLSETPELFGAESYVLDNVRDLETARAFLRIGARFKEWVSWHGGTAEANPSGGNRFRGIYNIVLKSIGAAAKLHPDVRLDYVIDYAAPMGPPGFYFMDSPGNDLESLAGQVASGCNLILFVTGNGSITNSPLAPTVKIVTTTARYERLSNEMDLNAGAYLDGVAMEKLGAVGFEEVLFVAGGRLSKGELAGHSQVTIWRNWMQSDATELSTSRQQTEPSGKPFDVCRGARVTAPVFPALRSGDAAATERIGLILPTSLCAGQVALLAARRMNQLNFGRHHGLSRFVALAHTEGCAVSGQGAIDMYKRTMLGYMTHPNAAFTVLMEHGCEVTHNGFFRHEIARKGIEQLRYGWVSIQGDGGFDKVIDRVEEWFRQRIEEGEPVQPMEASFDQVVIGLMAAGRAARFEAAGFGLVAKQLLGMGSTVIVSEGDPLLNCAEFLTATGLQGAAKPNLAYGKRPEQAGLFILENPTGHWVEALTGLGGSGVQIFLTLVGDRAMQTHPMIPVIQVTPSGNLKRGNAEDIDYFLRGPPTENASALLELLVRVASRKYTPKMALRGNEDFQFSRGRFGVTV